MIYLILICIYLIIIIFLKYINISTLYEQYYILQMNLIKILKRVEMGNERL